MQEIKITDINGFKFGNAQNFEAATGCTAILCEKGAFAGVDVRGGSPASRETELLRPVNTVQQIHAVMLSGETAAGSYPIEAVQTMGRIAESAEMHLKRNFRSSRKYVDEESLTSAVSLAAVKLATDLNAKAILTPTGSGYTAKRIAKYRPNCDIIAFSDKIVSIIIEGICAFAPYDFCIQAMNCHVHFAKLCVELNLFLPEKCKFVRCVKTICVHKITRAYKHSARTTSRIKHTSFLRLNDIYNHANKRFRRKENSIIACYILGELIKEVFIDTPYHIIMNVIKSRIIKNAKQLF